MRSVPTACEVPSCTAYRNFYADSRLPFFCISLTILSLRASLLRHTGHTLTVPLPRRPISTDSTSCFSQRQGWRVMAQPVGRAGQPEPS